MPLIFKNSRRLNLTSIAMALVVPIAFALCASAPANAQTPTLPGVVHKNTKAENALKPALTSAPQVTPPARPVRSVSLVTPKFEMWPDSIEAQGNVMPWQETRVGTEIGGLRVLSVLANVGDIVKKGQVLARLNPAPAEAELETANAHLMEVQGVLAQAVATLERANRLAPSGGVSQQEMTLYETQKQTAAARLNAARAQVKTQQLRLDSATLVAPDEGVISARSVAEGAIVQAGSELFRLIRQGRLEWRAEVNGEMLLRLSPGQDVMVKSPLGSEVKGRVRQIAPTVDLATRNGLVYVDLPANTNLKAGLHVSGTLAMNRRKALILPSSAVLHDGAERRVFKVDPDSKLEAVEVQVGRIRDNQEEITSGLDGDTQVIAEIGQSMKTGDLVNVQEAHEPEVAPASSNAKDAK